MIAGALRSYPRRLYAAVSNKSVAVGKHRVALSRKQPSVRAFASHSLKKGRSELEDVLFSWTSPAAMSGDPSKNFGSALLALNTLITRNKFKDHRTPPATALVELGEAAKALDIDWGKLRIVHVAGTKGKGSTCAMVERILRECGLKTGLFTSPHLVSVRERVRINGASLSPDQFATAFWRTWDALHDVYGEGFSSPRFPYLRFLTLMAMQAFLENGIDVAIIEVGLGGRLDATNVLRNPTCGGITTMGYDHVQVLGHTLTEITAEKCGIMDKETRDAYKMVTIPQDPEALRTIVQQCRDVYSKSGFVAPPLHSYANCPQDPLPQLTGQHQLLNAALAIGLSSAWMATHSHEVATTVPNSVSNFDWPGVVAGWTPVQDAGEDGSRQLQTSFPALPQEVWSALSKCRWDGRGHRVPLNEKQWRTVLRCKTSMKLDDRAMLREFRHDHGARADALLKDCPTSEEAALLRTPTPSDKAVIEFFLDGAHNDSSLRCCTGWFAGTAEEHSKRLLVFNCMPDRDPRELLEQFSPALCSTFSDVIFVPNDSSAWLFKGDTASVSANDTVDVSWQEELSSVWKSLHGDAAAGVHVLPTINASLDWISNEIAKGGVGKVSVLVTGSLYLVGDVLSKLYPEDG